MKTDKNIDDYQSVMLGIRKIKNDYRLVLSDYNSMSEDQKEYYGEGNLRYDIIERYNSGVNYFNDVDEIYTIIKDTFFKKQDDILLPIK